MSSHTAPRGGARTPDPRFWQGKEVCVTGGTGFLGYQIVRQLLDLGARVRVLALPPADRHPLLAERRVRCFFADVCSPAAVLRAVGDAAVVFHTAAPVGVWGPALRGMRPVHVTGTLNVLAAAPPGCRVVHTSSIVAVGASRTPTPVTEDSPFHLRRLRVDYVQAKRAAERLALEPCGRQAVVTNPGYLVGPDDHERSVMGRLCVRFWKGRVPLAAPGGFNLVDVRDVARGHLLAAEHGLPGRRYILGGEDRTVAELLRLLAEVAGFRPRGLPRAPGWLLAACARLAAWRSWLSGSEPYPAVQHVRLNHYYWYASSARAERELGYRARPLLECLHEAYRWHRENGRLALRGLNRWWMRPDSTAGEAA